MSALATRSVGFDPLLDKSYQATRLGRSVVDFLAWKRIALAADSTLDQYERDLARGALMFPDKGIGEITDGDMAQIASQFKDAERYSRVAAWKSFYKWAIRTRQVTSNPCDSLPDIRRRPQSFIDTFSDEEIEILTGLPLVDGALFQILFDVGLRKGEARRFKLAHYRSDRADFVVLGGKGGKDRIVPAMTGTTMKLNELVLSKRLDPQDHLWYSRRGNATGTTKIMRDKPINDASFDNWYYRCLNQAGIRHVKRKTGKPGRGNPHTTRHTFATRWLRRGGRLETLSLAMGHESIRTTFDLYGHLDTRDMAADLALIEGGA
jgi:integrase